MSVQLASGWLSKQVQELSAWKFQDYNWCGTSNVQMKYHPTSKPLIKNFHQKDRMNDVEV